MKYIFIITAVFALSFSILSCGGKDDKPVTDDGGKTRRQMNAVAESYVKLCFHIGKYDKDYVDAYFGPENLKNETETEDKKLDQIIQDTCSLIDSLEKLDVRCPDEWAQQRRKNLIRFLQALNARAEFLSGKQMTFDEESQALYDAVSPSFPLEHYDEILNRLNTLLPGDAPLEQKMADLRNQFIIPPDKVEAVFNAAIDEARKRTKAFIDLPENESFDMEFVTGKSWGAYNWFKGNAKSLIQVNTDLPISIDRAVDLACHEGYPGHHVYSTLIEEKLYKKKGWVEYSIYPLFSPISLISEGTANFGIEVAFPGEERAKFDKEVLCPLAGLDPSKIDLLYKIQQLSSDLGFAGNDTGRLFIDRKITRDEAAAQLMKYQLRSRERAEKYLDFIQQYRSYIVNYNLGLKMVRDYMERKGTAAENPQKLRDEFKKLLSSPILPGDLK